MVKETVNSWYMLAAQARNIPNVMTVHGMRQADALAVRKDSMPAKSCNAAANEVSMADGNQNSLDIVIVFTVRFASAATG
jgi:hypothetical protein